MIRTLEDYRFHMEADRLALARKSRRPRLDDHVWRFERLLRKYEFYSNCKRGWLWKPYRIALRYRFLNLSTKLGYTIPINTFGPGLSISHYGTIAVVGNASVGENCRLHICVVIAARPGLPSESPRIGDNVYIGPGVKIYGGVTIADGIAIGANSVVNKSFLEPGVTIAGIPAVVINAKKGSEGLLTRATDVLRRDGGLEAREPETFDV